MRPFLWLTTVIGAACTGICLLALGMGGRFPNTVVAYSETCNAVGGGFVTRIYVADWRPGLRFSFPESAVLYLPASWSPDGDRLAYSVQLEGQFGIYVRDLQTGAVRHLTEDQTLGAINIGPNWSPNGRSIAFYSGSAGLVTVADTPTNRAQTFPIRIANNVYSSAWSPDGDSLVVSGYYTRRSELYILNVVSGEIHDLSRGQFDLVGYPSWSPDGRHITFSAADFPGSAIYLLDLQTDTLLQLSRTDAPIYIASAWSPDGQTIAATTDQPEVHLFDRGGRFIRTVNLEQISGLEAGQGQVQWSPDGSYLILHVPVNAHWVNYVYDLSTGAVHSLSPQNCAYSAVDWRPEPPA